MEFRRRELRQHAVDLWRGHIQDLLFNAVGFPAQLTAILRNQFPIIHVVETNSSRWDCRLEASNGRYKAVRLGLRMARDLSNADAAAIVAARGDDPYVTVEEIQRRAGVGRGAHPPDEHRPPAI